MEKHGEQFTAKRPPIPKTNPQLQKPRGTNSLNLSSVPKPGNSWGTLLKKLLLCPNTHAGVAGPNVNDRSFDLRGRVTHAGRPAAP